MSGMIQGFFQKGMGKALKENFDASIGFKFMSALIVAVSVLMVMGTFFVARMLMEGQYQALETRGREMGQLLGKAGSDALLHRDIPALDGLVAETVKSPDMLYTYVADSSNVILNSASASFNRAHPDMKELLAQGKIEDAAALAAKAKEKLDPVQVQVDVKSGETRLGSVTMGFSRAAVLKEARGIVWLLLGTSVLIVGCPRIYARPHGAAHDRSPHQGSNGCGLQHCGRGPPAERARAVEGRARDARAGS